uniref:Sulfotransferase n=1 Tax=Ciona savignyi TaxID=51511 RepID=H2YT14_CIOSA
MAIVKIFRQRIFIFSIFFVGIYFGYYWRFTLTTDTKNLLAEQRYTNVGTSVKHCQPKTNIFFMKTHKTAGTTVQNVLLRYANTHELVVGLPATADPRFNYPSGEFFNRTFVRKSEKPINMLCHHMRFHAKEVKAILPDDTFYVTIIREAGSLFESMFDYFHYNCKAFARTPLKSWAIDEFLSQPNR